MCRDMSTSNTLALHKPGTRNLHLIPIAG